jgi:hypothetical protein
MEGWYSNRCILTWKMKDTPYRRSYFQLAVSVLPTEDTASGLLLTPTTMQRAEQPEDVMARAKRNGYRTGTKFNSLTSQLLYGGMLLTPSVTAIEGRSPEALLKRKEMRNRSGRKTVPPGNLAEQMQSLAQGGTLTDMSPIIPGGTAMSGTPTACRSIRTESNRIVSRAVGKSSQLNPLFVEEMMGFPKLWTALPFLNGAQNP